MHFQLPIKINSLLLDESQQVIGQDIVFENIPWFNQQEEAFINSLTPFVSQSVIPRPFSNDNLISLRKGMHLHWSLPSILKTFDEYGTLPEVPNRWLIIKEWKNGEKEEWILESDYLWNINQDGFSSADISSYPIVNNGKSSDIKDGFEFKYVGRKYLRNTIFEEKRDSYLDSLTALGWGSLSFDSHYGNCRSVFGFHDENFDPEIDTKYTVCGYYSKNKKDSDYFKRLIDINRSKLKDRIKSVDLEKLRNDELFRNGIYPDQQSANTISDLHSTIITNLSIDYLFSEIDKSIIFDIEHAFKYFINTSSFKTSKYHQNLLKSPIIVNDWKINSFSDFGSDDIKTICFGIFEYQNSNYEEYEDQSDNLNVSIANTLPEALTSILLKDDESVEKLVQEEQLEAILNWGELNDKNLDWVSRLRNKRHENQFKTIGAINKWEIISSKKETDETEKESQLPKVPLSTEKRLDILNIRQSQLDTEQDRLYHDLESMYMDWHTYLMSLFVYKKEDISNSNIRVIIEKKILPLISKTEGKIKELKSKIYNQKKYISDLLGDQFVLELKNDFNYYEPISPTVIVYDDSEKESVKNRNIDFLRNSYKEVEKEIYLSKIEFDENGIPFIGDEKEFLFKEYTSINTWNTYKIEWEAFFISHKNNESKTEFSFDFLTSNYVLDDQNADLIKDHHLQNLPYSSVPNLYYGSSFVNDTVKDFVEGKLDAFLNSQDIENIQITNENTASSKKTTSKNRQYIQKIKSDLHNIDLLEISLSDFNNVFTQRTSALNVMPLIPNGFKDHRELAATISNLIKKYEPKLNLLTPNSSAKFNPFRNGAFKVNRLRLVDTFGRDKILNINEITTGYHQQISNKKNWISLPPRLAQPATISGKWEKLSGTDSPVLGWLVVNVINNRLEIFNYKGDYTGAFNNTGKWEPSPFDYHSKNEESIAPDENNYLNLILNWLSSKAKHNTDFVEDFIEEIILSLKNIEPESYHNPSILESISTTPLTITKIDISLAVKGGIFYDVSTESQKKFSEKGGERNDLNYSKVEVPINVGDPNQYNDGCVAYWHCEYDNGAEVSRISEEIYFNNSEKVIFNIKGSIDESICDLDNSFRFSNQNSDDGEKSFEMKRQNLIYFLEDLMNNSSTGYINKKDFLKNYIIEGTSVWIKLIENKVLIPYKGLSENEVIKLKKNDQKSRLSIASELKSKSYMLLMHPKGDLFIKSGILPITKLEMPFKKIQNSLRKIALTIYTGPIITPKDNFEITLLKDHKYQWSWIELQKENPKLPIGEKNGFKKIRLTQVKSIDLKKCNIETYFSSKEVLAEYLFNQRITTNLKPSLKNNPHAYIVVDHNKKRELIDKTIYDYAEQKFYDKRWKIFHSNFGENYTLAEIINYTSNFKKTLLDNNLIYDAPIFKDEKYIVVTEKYFEILNQQNIENERVLKRINLLSPDEMRNVEIHYSRLINVDDDFLTYLNISLRSHEYLQSELLQPDDFFVGEHIYFINEKPFIEFEVIYNDLNYIFENFSNENVKKVSKNNDSFRDQLIRVESFAKIFNSENIPVITLQNILDARQDIIDEGKEKYEVLFDFFERIEILVFTNNPELLKTESVKTKLLSLMNSKEKNFKPKLKIHYNTFEFILANNQAISFIDDFNTKNTSVPQIMMKEGWLSIKSTNY